MLTLLLTVGTASATTITVNSLTDPGSTGICALRDAITAANTKTVTNGCAAGTGKDTIRFSVTGTILLAGTSFNEPGTLPQITDKLTINGPITIDGTKSIFEVMAVASGATVTLSNVTIANGFNFDNGGAVFNEGTMTIASSTFSNNGSAANTSAISNQGTLTVTDSSFTA